MQLRTEQVSDVQVSTILSAGEDRFKYRDSQRTVVRRFLPLGAYGRGTGHGQQMRRIGYPVAVNGEGAPANAVDFASNDSMEFSDIAYPKLARTDCGATSREQL